MPPKKNRLSKKKDFEKVFKEGGYYRQGFISIRTVKNNLKFNRYGFVVSLKISKKAVVRNKIRRRLSEIVRLKLKEMKPGFDIVVLTQPGIIGRGYRETEQTLVDLFKKSGIYGFSNPNF
ncbi:MAG: ribonuclease P protein component [Candidatus Portnoybacteria bacterium RIFCSPLOWO2_01_FULL_43_11]|uniref:Ribonuclease P protein component n=4 Tax=Candidatus Portnoyibacteriota TaxID=1817913 RepID=A0A1G2FD56_9BACT|nr:MAG: ribonuclease P protein component [Candidatus Portnoybacteria bacterium RIFCSPHIGHO2_01_FULL_40_12b]OGZ37373.1 MAG: ribonuclease P protein component [Candidatus Portnoybacteria bacterium RIFCSPHIGHO2_02_FULL_40_23]OGZ38168.1 MAG: ribonuclease P protein component [Candidatus Portnoybacteria bacterium RIFCSPLOWO2_01_FULL_43_11]OGZ38223.1 MAG: ribonuclease P protein component [Candidatus Portnoybacteria bacterium RIFCSPHIGHO2_12_FULL_40_11]OGZ40336.1 MAG: ribonuclease P protein component [C